MVLQHNCPTEGIGYSLAVIRFPSLLSLPSTSSFKFLSLRAFYTPPGIVPLCLPCHPALIKLLTGYSRGGLAENEVIISPFEDIVSVWSVEGDQPASTSLGVSLRPAMLTLRIRPSICS